MEARLQGIRPKGRSAKRCMDCIKQDIKIGVMTEVGRMAMDREACIAHHHGLDGKAE